MKFKFKNAIFNVKLHNLTQICVDFMVKIQFFTKSSNFRTIFDFKLRLDLHSIRFERFFKTKIADGDEFHRALLCKAQQSINNNMIILIVQNQTYRGRQGRVNSELTFDLSVIY